MGQPVHPARALAVSLDLGDGLSSRTGMGIQRPKWHAACGRRNRAAAGPHRSSGKENGKRKTLMELLLILIYVAICYVIFKLFRIPVNQWSLATATLGGIFGITLMLLLMNYNHPFTKDARVYYITTPIISDIKGRVIE